MRAAKQTRDHHCHWPGCDQQVPPARWGCREHWFALPKHLRDRIWDTYRPGQEATMSPSKEYLEAADAVQQWIASQRTTRTVDNPKNEAGSFAKDPAEDAVKSHLASIALCLATSRGDVSVQLARVQEEWRERAAIREYLAGLPRWQAEREAVNDAGIALGAIRW